MNQSSMRRIWRKIPKAGCREKTDFKESSEYSHRLDNVHTVLGWFTDWDQTDFSSKHETTYQTEAPGPWEAPDYVDPYKQYKETHNIR